jgi:hypothetical protein
MNLLDKYYWHDNAVLTKHKHIILAPESSLKYSVQQLSFVLPYKAISLLLLLLVFFMFYVRVRVGFDPLK